MPSAENIQLYLTGAWRMMMGKADGLRLLDLSVDGFWNSFFAIVIALPALIVGWVGVANELSQISGEFGSKLSILVRLAVIDLATWILPLVALAAVASRAGIADRFVALVVASNWASALFVWIMLPAVVVRPHLAGLRGDFGRLARAVRADDGAVLAHDQRRARQGPRRRHRRLRRHVPGFARRAVFPAVGVRIDCSGSGARVIHLHR